MGIGLTDSVTAIGKVGKAAAKWHVRKNQLRRHAIAYQELELEKDIDGDGVIGGVGCRSRDRGRLRHDDDPGRLPDSDRTPDPGEGALAPEDRPREARDSRRRPPRKPSKSRKSRKSRKRK